MATFKFDYNAPRWAKLGNFIKQRALWHSLVCNIVSDNGWLTERGVVVCEGTDDNVLKFKNEIECSINEYNN